MENVLVSLRLSLVRYGFVEIWGCLHGPSCIVLKMLQVFMHVSGGKGRGLWTPENRRNIVFPCNAGPVKNHKVANLAFNVGPSSVCQQIQWPFGWWPDVVTLMCGSRGGGQGVRAQLDNHKTKGFLSNTGLDPLKNHKVNIQCWAIIGTPAKRHLNGVSLAGR